MPDSGVLILGQPGIGKTFFQYYLLICLLHENQVVLFTVGVGGRRTYLFFFDTVYTKIIQEDSDGSNSESEFSKSTTDGFIWSLFDTRRQNREPSSHFVQKNMFVVQSLVNGNYLDLEWAKRRTARICGMSLWTRQELEIGFRYHPRYKHLMKELKIIFQKISEEVDDDDGGGGSSHSKIADQQTQTVAEKVNQRRQQIIQKSKSKSVLQDHIRKSAYPDVFRFLSSTCTCIGIDNMDNPESAIHLLMTESIYRFGYVARDVFEGIFARNIVLNYHQRALQDIVSFQRLKNMMTSGSVGSQYEVIAQIPIDEDADDGLDQVVKWKFCLKSKWVEEELRKRFLLLDDDDDIHVDSFANFISRRETNSTL
ncbi:hypothetical protein C8Q75DRAFT_785750 [Abortiporus biennis]|nr:hypothetical protein C8Q75DRAFT_785750 [Abortiporus biennis]